jgi:hypothetical protein
MNESIFESEFFWTILLIIVLVFFFFHDRNENKKWDKFKKEHKCKIVSYIDGDTNVGVGIGSKGPIPTLSETPDKAGWLCDDGMTYFKDK